MKKPLIGICTSILRGESGSISGVERAILNSEYIKAVEKGGGNPILLAPIDNEEDIKAQVALCDGILLSGGNDISPLIYGEEPHKNLGSINMRLDHWQSIVAKEAIEKDIAVLGICRGEQLINVVCKGTLYQDMDEFGKDYLKHVQEGKRYDVTHSAIIEKETTLSKLFGEEIFVNSYHHQSVKRLGEGLKVAARAKDGIIEAIEMENKRFVVGVQWHPEIMLEDTESMLPLFKEFIRMSTK